MIILNKKHKFIFKNIPIIAFFIFFYVTSFLFLSYKILDVPPGINTDEAIIGYNAALVSRTGIDSRGIFLPLFVATKDSLDWKQPITFYATVISFISFGVSYFNLRATSIIFALSSATIVFFLIKELLDIKKAVFGVLIFIITPIVVIQSHLALENIAPVPFISLWLLMLIKYFKFKKNKYIIISALSLGVSVYSYLGLRLIMPVLTMASLVYIYLINIQFKVKKSWRKMLIFMICILPFLILLIFAKKQYPGAIIGENRPSNTSSYQQILLPYLSAFDPTFLFIQGDATPYHSTGKHGMFLISTLPLLALGIFQSIRKNDFIYRFILLTFFLSPLIYGITPSIHRASRLLFLLPFYIIFICLGWEFFLGIKKRLWKIGCLSLIILLIALNSFDFIYDYWYEYPKRVKSEFSKPYHLVFERAHDLAKENDLEVFIQKDFKSQHQIAMDFFEKAYFPDSLKFWQQGEPLPKRSIIIVSDYIVKIEQAIAKENFDDYGFGLLINK